MIICFSGTGNSKMVADRIAATLGEHIVMMRDVHASDILDFSLEKRVIWIMPVHSWGMPKAVAKFISEVETIGDQPGHYLVCTCGDDCGLIERQWRRAIARRGWKPVAAHSVFMPNTYVTLPGFDVDSESVADAKLEAMVARVDKIVHAIKCSSKVSDIFRGRFAWLKSRIIYPLFMRWLTSPGPFRSSEKCVGCGRCAAICPLKNIELDQSRHPHWGQRCTLCLGCYHVCPVHSVEYGSRTRKKGQWQGALKSFQSAE